MNELYSTLSSRWPGNAWLAETGRLAQQRLHRHPHGDLPRWQAALAELPVVREQANLDHAAPRLGAPAPEPAALRNTLMRLHPWRKGPLELGGVRIETEWRSDWKWARLAKHVDLRAKRVLDVGCGNGYFGYRMLGAGAQLVVGIDPTLLFVMQWLACQHFAGDQPNFVLPLGIEDLPAGDADFDTVFSMGVLYHRRDPAEHLQRLRSLMKKKGSTLVLETLVLPKGEEKGLLVPESRYARMRNVWAIPGTDRLSTWLRAAGYQRVELVDTTPTSIQEQRTTPWMQFDSLPEALDPVNPSLTVEGYPAPVRALVVAGR